MALTTDMLRLEVLLRFYREDHVTVSGLSRDLGEEKYTISRLLSSLEEEGLVDRSNNRHPELTVEGKNVAKYYSGRVEKIEKYLLCKGVGTDIAYGDAQKMALYLSDEAIHCLHEEFVMEFARKEFRNRRKLSGSELFAKIPDGEYSLSFMIYREKANHSTNVSMANEGFEHPGLLKVSEGQATVELQMTTLNARSSKTGETMKGKVKSLQYFDGNDYLKANIVDDTVSFPINATFFYNMQSRTNPSLHGTLPVKISANVGTMHMPESVAFFTIFL